MKKVIINPHIGEVTIIKCRRNKNIRISVSSRGRVRISIPTYLPYYKGIYFLEQKEKWVIECIRKQKIQLQQWNEVGRVAYIPNEKSELDKYKIEAKSKLEPQLIELATKNGFTYPNGDILINRISIKHNISNWGSCSIRNNINLNMCLLQLPEYLQEYVILHELCHLKYRNHSRYFHQLLDTLCNGREKEFIKELQSWRIEYR